MTTRADVAAIVPFTDALRRLGIRYYIGGSVASSAHGHWRSTADLDIIADIDPGQAEPLARLLQDRFYIDAQMIRDAIRNRSSFNVIFLEMMYKLDIFPVGERAFDRSAWNRTVLTRLFEDHDEQFPIASAEDVILSKLEWYRAGGEISERQWTDVIGVMKIQSDNLDWDYLRRWAPELEVIDLLERARREAEA
jgi:hypothetical protein